MATDRSAAEPPPAAGPGGDIRPPRADELERLRAIEVAAGRPFADLGMDWVAAHEPPSPAELDGYRRAGRAWVVVPSDARGSPAGYVVVDVLADALAGRPGGALHVEQVSVDPAFAHRRLGRRLIDHVAGEARARGLPALTLTTFRDVPWNAPYYERCGFRVVSEPDWGSDLARVRAQERARGLDVVARVAMWRPA